MYSSNKVLNIVKQSNDDNQGRRQDFSKVGQKGAHFGFLGVQKPNFYAFMWSNKKNRQAPDPPADAPDDNSSIS